MNKYKKTSYKITFSCVCVLYSLWWENEARNNGAPIEYYKAIRLQKMQWAQNKKGYQFWGCVLDNRFVRGKEQEREKLMDPTVSIVIFFF